MSGALLIVPCTYGVTELGVFEGLRVVVLDELLFAGFSGVYFRRLFVQAALDPGFRLEYELRRTQYLQCVLSEERFQCDAVFIGSRASDVDLMDFRSVYAVQVPDRCLRNMSRLVYGDPIMMYMDYHGVLAAVEQAVDESYIVKEWAEIPLLIARKFQERVAVDVAVPVVRQRAILQEILREVDGAQVWLEEAVLQVDITKRTFMLADYDYLTFVRPLWRDAVVRMLGRAPSVAEVFRLPWCLVDSAALNSLCYRPNISGRPTASARGKSLIEFVQTRLAGSMTTREIVGTWVGGLLCDDLTAVDTILSLGDATLASSAVGSGAHLGATSGYVRVPSEYAWMYAAVGRVVVSPWGGDRELDGSPIVDSRLSPEWSPFLIFADVFAGMQYDPVASVCVVQFMSRLHGIVCDSTFLARLYLHAREVFERGVTRANFDEVLTPMLPGYNYLAAFASGARLAAAQALGLCPGLGKVLVYVDTAAALSADVSSHELCAEASRLAIYAGRPFMKGELVGHEVGSTASQLGQTPGYCYECLFEPRYQLRVRRIFRAYPSLSRLMDKRYACWRIPNALESVRVSKGELVDSGGVSSIVLHMSLDGGGMSLQQYLSSAEQTRDAGNADIRVGQAGVCYSSGWYVSAIIAWTAVGCVLVSFLAWLLHGRCSRARSGSTGARRLY